MASPSVGISTPPAHDTAPVASVRGVSHTYGTTAHSTPSISTSPPAAWSA